MIRVLLLLMAAAGTAAEVPRTWTDAEVAGFEVPTANPRSRPVHISESVYYSMPTRVLYRTYPVYHPSREPAGYFEWLKQQEPQPAAFDAAAIKTEADWIKAGEQVFNAPVSFGPVFFGAAEVRNPAFFEETKMPVAKDGTISFARWVVREKGKVELGSMGCNTCHTRVLPNGDIVPGAQGNNPGDRQGAWMLRRAAKVAPPGDLLGRLRTFARQFEVPGLDDDPNARAREMGLDELIAAGEAIPAGVTARSHTSMLLPPQIPDLIGVRQRRFLDHTGLVRHRGPADLMRYTALVQDTIGLARYADGPAPGKPGSRYSDEQLYALAMYLYSLEPPANPNRVDAATEARGRKVFAREGCAGCHTPGLYTNNKLIPADGFEPPAATAGDPDVMTGKRVGTDPRYALQTKKGTGYYKVPSLLGVWYRGPLEHHGSVATLEDWFDPARLRQDYVPTGYAGPDGKRRGVRGHEFGLKLSAGDRRALIAFLGTL